MENKEITIQFPWAIILTLIFAVLKVAGVLNITWFWVFIPIWFMLGVMAFVVVMLIVIYLASQIFDYFS